MLVVPDPAVIGPLLAPHGGSTDQGVLIRAHYAAMRSQDRAWGEGEAWGPYDMAYVRAVGVPEDEVAEAAELLGQTRNSLLWRHPVPGGADVLRALNRLGVPIGIVSNATGQIERVLERAGICQTGEGRGARVEVVVDSHVVGVAKPDPRIFSFALVALATIDPSRVAYVGDSVHNDVIGARSAGLVPLHLDPHDDHADADHERIRALSDLLAWV